MAPDKIIEVRGLTKKFGRFTAVDGIDFSVRRGEILGFLGPNGAGKTTTIKMINGLLRITEGEVRIDGLDIRKDLRRIKRMTGYMSQKFSLYPLLTPVENIEFFGGISGLSPRVIKNKVEEIRGLIPSQLLENLTEELPPGIKQQVALYVSMISDPEILFLDEPTSGVDPETRRRFWNEIYALKTQEKTLLVTTHNLDEAEFADRILIIHHGELILEGEPESLMKEYKADSVEVLFKEAIFNHETN